MHVRRESAPARGECMEQLRFPMFVDLHGRCAVVVGGGKVGARRANVLLQFGAEVTVIDPAAPPVPGTVHVRRGYLPGDLQGAFICIAATDSRTVNYRVGQDARALGVPVSVADAPDECDFFFPAVCVGEGIVAGVVSSGSAHEKTVSTAGRIRRMLEETE